MFEDKDLFISIEEAPVRNRSQVQFLFNLIEDTLRDGEGKEAMLHCKSHMSDRMKELMVAYVVSLPVEDRQTVASGFLDKLRSTKVG